MNKKSLQCPICGSKGEDMIFAFYCANTECQNFRDAKYEDSEDYEDDWHNDAPFWGDSYLPYEVD